MMRFAKTVLTASLLLAIASPATAKQAQLEFESRTEAQLEAGDRARVIVTFNHTPIATDAPVSAAADLALAASITEQREAVFTRVFAASSAELAAGDISESRLHRAFDYTPAAAMYLTREEIEALAADPDVVRIETDGWNRPSLAQSIPQIGAALLHAVDARGADATVAILDTGIHYNHPAFSGRISRSACFSSSITSDGTRSACINRVTVDTSNAQAARACFPGERILDCDHGTHVASIAAGARGTAPGVATYDLDGVAPDARIVPVQVFSELYLVPNDCPSGNRCPVAYDSDLIAALEWLYASRQTLNLSSINMSLGGDPIEGACDDAAIAPIIGQLRAVGIPTIIAAGNDFTRGSMSHPACVTDSVSVAALSTHGSRATYSNVSELTDFYAPGSDISAAGYPDSSSSTATYDGTSMAAPHVAGGFALLRSIFPSATLEQIETAIRQTGPAILGHQTGTTIPGLRLDLAAAALEDSVGHDSVLDVSPEGRIVVTGDVTGEQSYEFARFVLTNTGNIASDWSVHTDVDWLSFSLNTPGTDADQYDPRLSGTLAPGASIPIFVRPTGFFEEGTSDAVVFFAGNGRPTFRNIRVETLSLRPPNDDIEDAFVIRAPEQAGIYSGALVRLQRATLQAGERHHGEASNSVWFYFDPPETQGYEIVSNAAATGVYSTNDVMRLQDFRVGEYTTSYYGGRVIRFVGEFGQRLYIAIADPIQDEVSFELRRRAGAERAGDHPATPVWLTGRSGRVLRDLDGTQSLADGEPTLGHDIHYRAWFAWQAPYTGTLELADRIADQWRIENFDVFVRTDGATTHAVEDAWDLLEPVASVRWDSEPVPSGSDDSDSRVLTIGVEEGRTYWFRTSHFESNLGDWRFTWGQPRDDDHTLRGAVLPNMRNVLLGRQATAFMTVVNPARFPTARNCRIVVGGDFNASFSYRFTNASNEAYGDENPVFDLEPGAAQSFVLAFRASTPRDIGPEFSYLCDNVVPHEDARGADNFVFRTRATPGPDIVMVALTPTGNGILDVPSTGASAFSIAAINIGSPATDIISTIETPYGTSAEICETNPATGICLQPRSPWLRTNFEQGQVRTFTIFVRGRGGEPMFNPAVIRTSVQFGQEVWSPFGATSIAIRVVE